MKTIVLCLAMIFLAGCLDSGYRHVKYDSITGKPVESWTLDYSKAMATTTITDVNLVLSDGSCLSFSKSAWIYDGNDWVKMGEGVAKGSKPFMIFW